MRRNSRVRGFVLVDESPRNGVRATSCSRWRSCRRPSPRATVLGVLDPKLRRTTVNSEANEESRPGRLQACAEIALIFALFFALAGSPPPDVNEAHYLAKAKHYWNPGWCPQDHFLNSADAHLVFYWVFGWLTLFFSLPTVAWIGRILTWWLLAWSWRRLSFALVPANLHSVLTAALFTCLMRWGQMAGEWVIGGVEAKGFAYVLVFLALESLVRGHGRRAGVQLGGATAFHVLVGGWMLVATALTWLISPHSRRPSLRSLFPALLIAALLALPGLIPGLALSWSADPDTVNEANRIYVFGRLSHHLVFHELPYAYVARHLAVLLAWLFLVRWLPKTTQPYRLPGDTVNRLVGAAVAIAIMGVMLDKSLLYDRSLAASVLRYYWFRLSDVMVPLGAAFAASTWLRCLSNSNPRLHRWALLLVLLLVSANVSHIVYEHLVDPRPGAVSQSFPENELSPQEKILRFQEWRLACDWVKHNTRPDALFLTPRNQQTFKWYAQRSEVVCLKDIPQDAAGIVEWRHRLVDVYPWTARTIDTSPEGHQKLIQLARKYKFEYVVLDRRVSKFGLQFPRVYPEGRVGQNTYEVYLVLEE